MKHRLATLCLFSLSALLLPKTVASAEPAVDFARQVLPILSNKCYVCHGAAGEARDVLRLDSFAGATTDLDGHKAIDPDTPGKSSLLHRINSTDEPMPPEDAEKQLTAEERELLSRWIRQGGAYATHWAFVAPKKELPGDASAADGSAAIDAFIRASLKTQRASFSAPADKQTLARRVALVLTGLPPEPDQLASFLADRTPGAYAQLVDQLLDSPRYGEHQARYWLDAVRYGDTHGLHLDNRRGIYPYRDWVINALNRNIPLDDFITWQLAGDLLPSPTLEQRVATGFVRMNPSTAEGGAIPAEFQAKNNFDRVETLGTVFLGMSLTCARCHTHKYDPIPQTEYYRLMAFFNSTAENSMDGNKYEYGPVLKAPGSVEAWKAWNDIEATRAALLTQTTVAIADLDAAVQEKWRGATSKDQLGILADAKGPLAGLPMHSAAVTLNAQITEQEKAFTSTLVARDLETPRVTKVLTRGEYDLPVGDALEPGIVKVMSAFPAAAPRNRLGLAQWLTSRQHPLVARVLVNRIWQHAFGYGLVRTPEDFGLQGEQPTHPALLDWLAIELHDSSWDLKHMLRLLVSSRTFQQSSAWRRDLADPDNRLWARGPSHRLDAEVIRDIGLWASGLYDPYMGGEGIKPYQPKGLWSALMHPGSNTKLYVPDTGDRLYRRSLYVYWKRTSPHPMMALFDAPNRESSCVKRSRTNTSLQSLGLLNETQRIEMGRQLAARAIRSAETDRERLDYLFTLLACRKPTRAERAACLGLLTTMQDRFTTDSEDAISLLSTGDTPRDESLDAAAHAAWTQVAVTVLASDIAILLY